MVTGVLSYLGRVRCYFISHCRRHSQSNELSEFFTNINAAHVQRFMDLDNLPFEHQLPRFPAPALVAIRHCLEILSVEHENPSRKTPALHGIEKALNSVRFFTGPPFKVHTALRWKIGLRYAMIDKGLVEAICRLFRTESAMTDPQWDRYLPAFVEQLGSLSVGCETAMEMVLQEMCAAQDNFNSAHTPGVLNFAGLLSNPTKNRILQAAFRTGDWEPALQAVLAMRDHFPTGELLCLPNVFMADPNPDRARGWLVGRISLIKPLFRAVSHCPSVLRASSHGSLSFSSCSLFPMGSTRTPTQGTDCASPPNYQNTCRGLPDMLSRHGSKTMQLLQICPGRSAAPKNYSSTYGVSVCFRYLVSR